MEIEVEKIEFTNRRVGVKIGRTIKTSPTEYDFFKFDLESSGDIPDGVDKQKAWEQLFKETLGEVSLREAIVRAVGTNKEALEQVVQLLKLVTQGAQ